MAFGSACAFCAEIAELRRSPRFPFRVVGTRTLFSAPQARTLPGDLMISACSAQKAVVTRPRTFAINPHPDSHRHSTAGTGQTEQKKSVFCSEIERGRMRNAVRGHVCDHNRASSLMAGRVALPIRWADPLGRSVGQPIRICLDLAIEKESCLRTILSQSDVIRNMNIEIGQGCCDGSK
jgi:hypothetical protein